MGLKVSGRDFGAMKNSTQPLVYVNIVVWNGKRWLKKCLDSLLNTHYDNFRILAIDNHSTDHSLEIIRREYPQVELIRNQRNVGFAEGHNIGIRYVLKQGADYIALLNQDIVADPSWLVELVHVTSKHKNFGVLAPMQYDYEGKNIDPVFLRILNRQDDFKMDRASNLPLRTIYEVPLTFGAAMFFRRETFLKVGLFDPLYFSYNEEVDFFQRARYHGIKTAIVTTSKINHWHVSRHPRKKDVLRISYFAIRNRYMAILKDPSRDLSVNVRQWVMTVLQDLREDCSSWKGFFFAAFRLLLQAWLIIHMPLIVFKRTQEKKKACYL